MGVIGGALGYRVLRAINTSGETGYCNGSAYKGRSKIEVLFGPNIWNEFRGKVVIDFGCGSGGDAVEIAQRGAAEVIGIDLRQSQLKIARQRAEAAKVADRCQFTQETSKKADIIFSMDGFEHYGDPAEVLRIMRKLLKDDGAVIVEFGPPWYHPLGGHSFSVVPWAHLVFTERCLIRWRSDFKSDGAKHFSEIDGGLNKMSVRGFERLIAESDFEFESFKAVPIRRARWLANPLTREFLTSTVRCKLVPRSAKRTRPR